MDFKEAYLRLQEIHTLLQKEEIIDIEKLLALQNEAKSCYELCQNALKKITENDTTE